MNAQTHTCTECTEQHKANGTVGQNFLVAVVVTSLILNLATFVTYTVYQVAGIL